jgi:hypothetical protein
MDLLAKHPDRAASYENYLNFAKDMRPLVFGNMANATLQDRLLDTLTGVDVNIEELQKKYTDAVRWSKVGDRDAQELRARLEQWFGFDSVTGKIDPDKLKSVQGSLRRKLLSNPKLSIIHGRADSVDTDPAIYGDFKDLALGGFSLSEDNPRLKYEEQLKDNRISYTELWDMIKDGSDKDLTDIEGILNSSDQFLKMKKYYKSMTKKRNIGAGNKSALDVFAQLGFDAELDEFDLKHGIYTPLNRGFKTSQFNNWVQEQPNRDGVIEAAIVALEGKKNGNAWHDAGVDKAIMSIKKRWNIDGARDKAPADQVDKAEDTKQVAVTPTKAVDTRGLFSRIRAQNRGQRR